MKKQVYEINEQGFIQDIHIAEFDGEGNPIEEFDEEGNPIIDFDDNIVWIDPPNGLYRAKWTGIEWVEDMSQDDIDELNKPTIPPLTETELLSEEVEELKVAQAETDSTLLELMEIVLL